MRLSCTCLPNPPGVHSCVCAPFSCLSESLCAFRIFSAHTLNVEIQESRSSLHTRLSAKHIHHSVTPRAHIHSVKKIRGARAFSFGGNVSSQIQEVQPSLRSCRISVYILRKMSSSRCHRVFKNSGASIRSLCRSIDQFILCDNVGAAGKSMLACEGRKISLVLNRKDSPRNLDFSSCFCPPQYCHGTALNLSCTPLSARITSRFIFRQKTRLLPPIFP